MVKPLALIVMVLAAATALGGCSKCGWWYDQPAACKSDAPQR